MRQKLVIGILCSSLLLWGCEEEPFGDGNTSASQNPSNIISKAPSIPSKSSKMTEKRKSAKVTKTAKTIIENNMKILFRDLTKLSNTCQNLEQKVNKMEGSFHKIEQQNKKMCIACWEHESNFALVPCGHKLVCGTCAATLLHSKPVCPFCREKVRDVIQIWDASIAASDLPTLPTEN